MTETPRFFEDEDTVAESTVEAIEAALRAGVSPDKLAEHYGGIADRVARGDGNPTEHFLDDEEVYAA